jgi:hypothetical protein
MALAGCPFRHPGLDPGSMNTVPDKMALSVFMDSGFAGMTGGGRGRGTRLDTAAAVAYRAPFFTGG